MRRYGLLLHISSLPSVWGIGDLGPAAHAFAELLAGIGASVWQFLPVNPTSTFIGNSPYSSFSAFAGNSLFISPEFLIRDGYVNDGDLNASFASFAGGALTRDLAHVDYAAVTAHRQCLLQAAFERNAHCLAQHAGYQSFCREHAFWLHDYARFVSMKEAFGGSSWVCWPAELARRNPQALSDWDARAGVAMEREKFIQYLFFSQWFELRQACNRAGVSLWGDIPIYVTHDSADVWSHPQYFNLGEDLQPLTVSGVPPDYFSELGQRWGTPVYRWDILERDDFSWWKKRLGHSLLMADMARLDHFRGFCGYWDIPAEEKTAVRGSWKPAPGQAFFAALQRYFGGLAFIAENLGIITDDVRRAMCDFQLPGMHVLQFAFGGEKFACGPDVPHAHTRTSVVYTGTHDNAPTRAWFLDNASEQERENLSRYAGSRIAEENVSEVLARLAFASVADWAVLPVQDALHLGAESRMNTPGVSQGNWTWRMAPEQLLPEKFAWLKEYARTYGRLPHNC